MRMEHGISPKCFKMVPAQREYSLNGHQIGITVEQREALWETETELINTTSNWAEEQHSWCDTFVGREPCLPLFEDKTPQLPCDIHSYYFTKLLELWGFSHQNTLQPWVQVPNGEMVKIWIKKKFQTFPKSEWAPNRKFQPRSLGAEKSISKRSIREQKCGVVQVFLQFKNYIKLSNKSWTRNSRLSR